MPHPWSRCSRNLANPYRKDDEIYNRFFNGGKHPKASDEDVQTVIERYGKLGAPDPKPNMVPIKPRTAAAVKTEEGT